MKESSGKQGRPFLREENGEGIRRKTVTFSMDPDVYSLLRQSAVKEKVPMSQLVERLIVSHAQQQQGSIFGWDPISTDGADCG